MVNMLQNIQIYAKIVVTNIGLVPEVRQKLELGYVLVLVEGTENG